MKKSDFEKIVRHVKKELTRGLDLPFAKIISNALDECRIHVDERNGVDVMVKRVLEKEGWKIPEISEKNPELSRPLSETAESEEEKKPGMFSEKIMREIRKGAREAQINYDFEDALLNGGVSKEKLQRPDSEFEGKKIKDFPFGLPR